MVCLKQSYRLYSPKFEKDRIPSVSSPLQRHDLDHQSERLDGIGPVTAIRFRCPTSDARRFVEAQEAQCSRLRTLLATRSNET